MLTRFWRWLGFHVHDWGMWELLEVKRTTWTNVELPSLTQKFEAKVTVQERRCKACGKYQKKGV